MFDRIGFSALQRAENSSILPISDNPKLKTLSFSALQRAENSSIGGWYCRHRRNQNAFQCSSASRKFLNYAAAYAQQHQQYAFQCSSASRKFLNDVPDIRSVGALRFQCSSASRKFLNRSIPEHRRYPFRKFQCSSASRKFLNLTFPRDEIACIRRFQCSSASRKFLNLNQRPLAHDTAEVSVLFSEPKIPQSYK